MEQYATRIIKMNDGRIVEDKEIKKVENNIEIKTSKYNKITIANKYRLGIRNTFNTFSKFALLFVVFLFITSAVFAEYASFENEIYVLNQQSQSYYFKDMSPNRILIKKKDKTAFSNEDYENIKSISNVDYVVENDYFIDKPVTLFKGNYYTGMISGGYLYNLEEFRESLDVGKMPEKQDEVVIVINKNMQTASNLNNYLNQPLDITTTDSFDVQSNILDIQSNGGKDEVTIVGIKYSAEGDNIPKIYATSEKIADLTIPMNVGLSRIKYLFNGKYTSINSHQLISSKYVEKGRAIVSNDLKYQLTNGSIKNKQINILVNNIHYDAELNLKISKTYTKSNFKEITGLEDYSDIICINEEDYNYLFNKRPYQSSIYLKNVADIDITMRKLNDMGIDAKKITDFAIYEDLVSIQTKKVEKTVVTIIVIVLLSFISYFIIKIILKSRNTYYTTLRMLGANLKSIKRILDIELFINSNIAYFTVVIFMWMVKLNIINFEYVRNLAQYINFPEYLLMYIVLILMSRIISRSFSRKIFKKSTISTYNEEV